MPILIQLIAVARPPFCPLLEAGTSVVEVKFRDNDSSAHTPDPDDLPAPHWQTIMGVKWYWTPRILLLVH